jgi:hypothetical protein
MKIVGLIINNFKKEVLVLMILLSTTQLKAQNVSCEELIKHVKDNGDKIGNVGVYQLMDSSWLKEVTAYSIQNKIVVVAEIKDDKTSWITHKYIFCDIPKSNWESFDSPYDLNTTFGERFHTYIIDYKCNCTD